MAELTKYETYKPSGINWIGEVPIDWKTLRIKNVASIVNGSTPSSSVEEYWDGDIIWATPGDFNKFDKIIDDSESKITEAGYKSCGTSMVPVGSVVITTRAPIGNVLIAGKELCTNQGCKSLVPNRIESRFLYYIISISSIELNILGQGTTFLELSKESLGTFKLPLPKYDEQLAIANYLDNQTQKIDRLIANKKAQAERLKELRQIEINNAVTKGLKPNAEMPASSKVEMKDSGIEWLGKIPKHWEVKRLKNVADINATKQELKYEEVKDLEVVFLAMESVSENGQIDNSEKRCVSELW
ncbi:MAG: restriction endonuclease subunit S, partial [Bacteroidales bacterium]